MANRKLHPSFRMIPWLVWMTYSDVFKVMIIQRQVTWKWYNIQPYLRWSTNSIWSIERCHFQWPWMTPTPSFKVMPFFDAEYLINGTTYRHIFHEILIATYTRRSVISNDFSDLAKYSMTRSVARTVARSLCDRWASCSMTTHHFTQSSFDYSHRKWKCINTLYTQRPHFYVIKTVLLLLM